jgi:hypothetical protein
MASASRFRWSVVKEKNSSSLMSLIHFAAPIAKGLKNASVTGIEGVVRRRSTERIGIGLSSNY